ncbi:MAG: sialate O-acetylesterase [Planctomycetes bacterium]|nr:sialate O-acetylesterase [Planctomycetota bacterium]
MLKTSTVQVALAILLAISTANPCVADVKLPNIFSDHMVLQRDQAVPIWGWADADEEVTVSIADQTLKTKADADGRWRVDLAPLSVGDPLTLVVEGKNRLERNDILVGEVWVCSGQSNMGWTVGASFDADLHLLTTKNPQLRLLTVGNQGSQTPIDDIDGTWQRSNPKNVEQFSAVGYFFGLQLQKTLGVPVGLIDNAWGGSSCEAWIRRDLLDADPIYGPLMKRWKAMEANFESGQSKANYEKALAKWKQKKKDGKNPGRTPRSPEVAMTGQHRPANLFNARTLPIVPYAIRGAIWYQGESNASRAFQYREMFPLMIQNWRDTWGQGDFPFYWVQLADFRVEEPLPGDSDWAELREAQTMTLDRLSNTGEAVIIDLGEGNDIHPRKKFDVGLRLARWALAHDYQIDVPCQSPRFDSLTQDGGKLLVSFKDCGKGLHKHDYSEIKGFAIAGEDKKWVWADAKLVSKNQVEVSSEAVPSPVAVRYAWANNPVCNLISKEGLPVTPFRSDDWPGVTIEAR